MGRPFVLVGALLAPLVFTSCVFSKGMGPRVRGPGGGYASSAADAPGRYDVGPNDGVDGAQSAGSTGGIAGGAVRPTEWRQIGTSVQGRPLRTRTVGEGFRRVLWIGGIHGNEQEGIIATDQLPWAFAQTELPRSVTLMILEDINPDGRAASTRTNANGVDLNRNFPAENFDSSNPKYGGTPLSQPESKALHALLLEWQPHLVIVSHSWTGRTFINFDGPARELAADFARISNYPVVPSLSFAKTPGSLGSYVGHTLGWPILTLEYLNGKDPKQAWDETRDAILAVIAGA